MRESDVARMIDMTERALMAEKLRQEYEKQKAAEKTVVDTLLAKGEFLDEDGYPTSDALTIVELWPFEDEKGWFIFIESLWAMKSFGWAEGEAPHDWDKDKVVYLYELSTAGWSGNEAIIRSMEENDALWHMTWVQSRRGGHYIFERGLE
jgi:hypothetical protein